MLPLLREQDTGSSTVEERVIGAGLKALDKNTDGAAIKELFHMFAVTMEDFVHPIAVIELLWRSCCTSEAEQPEAADRVVAPACRQRRKEPRLPLRLELPAGARGHGQRLKHGRRPLEISCESTRGTSKHLQGPHHRLTSTRQALEVLVRDL